MAEIKQFLVRADATWFTTSRVKEFETFAQKAQSGRVLIPSALEDFVGAMIVVPLLTDIPRALDFVNTFFEEDYRRPKSSDETRKKSSDFPFDDLRLYGRLKARDDLPPRPIDSVLFEVQVKTFLQHAWSIATHDLVYKHDRASWPRSRVASQIKAMLEHAELSISAIDSMEQSGFLPSGEPESRLQRTIDLINGEWQEDVLPRDLRRLAETLLGLATAFGIEDIAALIERGKQHYGGHPTGWSPYQCFVDYSSLFAAARMKTFLATERKKPPYIVYITSEALNRLDLTPDTAPSARL